MAFSAKELDEILKRMAEERRKPKRKLDIQVSPSYNEPMSRVELLAKAFDAVVVEDQGYRGVIHKEDTNEFIRYHSTHGVHAVIRAPRVWRVTRSILEPEEVRPFLEECGLVHKIEATERSLV